MNATTKTLDRVAVGIQSTRAAGATLELLGRLMGELKDQTAVNVFVTPEFATVIQKLCDALAPWPEARAAVADVPRGVPVLEAPTSH